MPVINNVPTTQYIGPKIVPHFADPAEWSINNEYDALSIVTNNGNTYWAKYNVPSGIDISNTEYWYLSAYPDAQIQAYRNEVMEYAEIVDDYATQVTGFTNTAKELTDFTDAIGNISGTVTPYYAGHFIDTHKVQSCCVREGIAYMLCTLSDNTDTYVKAFDLNQNEELWTRRFDSSTIRLGHANDVCFDSSRNIFMICGLDGLYEANASFSVVTKSTKFDGVSIVGNVSRITYDHVTGYVWACVGTDADNTPMFKLYYLAPNANKFVLFSETEGLFNGNADLQSIAAWDDVIVANYTNGYIITHVIDRENKTCKAYKNYTYSHYDATDKYYIGEPEGMEFDENGYLYNCVLANITVDAVCVNMLFTLPYGVKVKKLLQRSVFQYPNIIISQATQNKFANAANELKSLAELDIINMSHLRNVNYDGTVTDNFNATFKGNVTVIINEDANVTFNNQIILKGGTFSIHVPSGSQEVGTRVTFGNANNSYFISTLNAAQVVSLQIGAVAPCLCGELIHYGVNTPIIVAQGIASGNTYVCSRITNVEPYHIYVGNYSVALT